MFPTLSSPRSLIRRFCGLRSLCRTLLAWQYAKPLSIWDGKYIFRFYLPLFSGESQHRACPHVGGWGLVQCSVHPSWLITLMRLAAQMGDIRKHPAVVFPNFYSLSFACQLSHSAQGLVDSLNIWRVTVLPMSTLFRKTLALSLQKCQNRP